MQGFEYLRHFLIDKGNPQNFSFQKKLRNFETFRIFVKIRPGSGSGSVIIGTGSADPDPDPYQNETDPQHCIFL